MSRNYEEERKRHQKIIDDNPGNKEIEEAQKSHIDKINKDEEKSKAKAEKKAKYEANLSRNDAGENALKRQQEAAADISNTDTRNFVDNSDEGIANAKAGDYIRRSNGEEYQLQQSDIDWAKNNLQPEENADINTSPEAQAEEITKQVTPEPEATPEPEVTSDTFDKGTLPNEVTANTDDMDFKSVLTKALGDANAVNQILQSDEAIEAENSVNNGDALGLTKIGDPATGEPIIRYDINPDGTFTFRPYTRQEAAKMGGHGWAGAATVISAALSALGVAFGIPLVPINFYKLTGTDAFRDQLNKQGEEWAAIANGGKKEANEIKETGAAKSTAYENAATSAQEHPELYNTETQNQVAGSQAAMTGQNTAIDVQKANQEWQTKQKELDREFQKEMNSLNTESAIQIANANAKNQQELARVMNDLDVQKVVKKIQFAKNSGMSEDELARWIRAESGTTKLAAGLGYAKDAGDVAGNIAKTFLGVGSSDKDCKKYVASNSNMLLNAWKRK